MFTPGPTSGAPKTTPPQPIQDRIDPEIECDDPLACFGLERVSPFFEQVVERFQKVLHGDAGLDWSFSKWRLQQSEAEIHHALGMFRDAGYLLRVCTGRHRDEIEAPIRELGLAPFLPLSEITSADEVDRAEADSGQSPLGKPHWFAPACATVGFDAALRALAEGTGLTGRGIYVGDAWADYKAVEACRALGLDLSFVHARSGVTTREQDRAIARAPVTLGFVNGLDELVPVLTGPPS